MFTDKTDCYAIADSTTIELKATDDGKTAQEVTAQGSDGSIVASEVFGEFDAPSCNYGVKAAVTWAAGAKKLGKVSAYNTSHKVAMLKIEISTSNGSMPTLKVSGQQVQDSAADGCTYSVPATAISPVTHAQILWSAFELSGSGCHLQSANYTAECNIGKETKNGSCIAFDVSSGKLTAKVQIKKVDSTVPTITAGQGWKIKSPLACSNPDADYPTYTAELVKYLDLDAQPAAQQVAQPAAQQGA